MMRAGAALLSTVLAAALLTTPGTGRAASPPPDLSGDWRLDLYVVSHARIPVLGTTTILARTIFQSTVDGQPGSQVLHTRPCALHPQTTRPIATTTIPQAFVDHLPPKDVPLVMDSDAAGRWSFVADMQPQDVGWTRARHRPVPGALVPQDASHPAVLDFEGDGHPGATIHLEAPLFGDIEIYVVQTAHTVLSAAVGAGDVIEGSAHPRAFAQRTIGASNRLFISNPDIELDAGQSRFRLARVPAGTTCAALARGEGAGVPLRPEDVRPRD